MALYVWVYFWAVWSSLVIYVFVFMLIPYCLDSVISYTPKGDPQRKILWKIFSEHELTNSCFPFRPTFQTEIIVNKFRYLFFFKGFIYFGLFWVFSSFCVGFSLVAESGGYPQVAWLQCAGFSLLWLLSWSTGSKASGFSSCGTWAPQLQLLDPKAQAQSLQLTDLVVPIACGIFLDQGSNPCLLHWQVDSLPLNNQGNHRHLLKANLFTS